MNFWFFTTQKLLLCQCQITLDDGVAQCLKMSHFANHKPYAIGTVVKSITAGVFTIWQP